MTIQYAVRLLRERINKEKLPLTLVAFDAGKPVGTVSLTTFDMETKKDVPHWLTSLYVAKQWRRKMIGTSLVKTAEKKATDLEICKLCLFTTDMILPESFYSKLGWIVKETTMYHSQPVTIMEKDLCRK